MSAWYISGCRTYTLRWNSVLLFKQLQLITHTCGMAHGIILKAPRSCLNESNLSLPTGQQHCKFLCSSTCNSPAFKNMPHFLACLRHVPFWRVCEAVFRDFMHNLLAACDEQKPYPRKTVLMASDTWDWTVCVIEWYRYIIAAVKNFP